MVLFWCTIHTVYFLSQFFLNLELKLIEQIQQSEEIQNNVMFILIQITFPFKPVVKLSIVFIFELQVISEIKSNVFFLNIVYNFLNASTKSRYIIRLQHLLSSSEFAHSFSRLHK